MEFIYTFVVPFLCALIVTAGKLMADNKLISTAEANGTALDMILVAAGAAVVVYAHRPVEGIFAAAVVDASLGVILLLMRYYRRHKHLVRVGSWTAAIEVLLGATAILYTARGI